MANCPRAITINQMPSQVQGVGEAQRGVGAEEDIATPCGPQRECFLCSLRFQVDGCVFMSDTRMI